MLQRERILWAAALLSLGPLVAAAQQAPAQPPTTPPTPSERAPQATPPPAKAPAVKPSEAPAAQDLVGLSVFSSDGTRIGEVRAVHTGPNGNIVALRVRTGGFLGFGGRTVAISEGRFFRSGQSIRLDLDSDQVGSLPEVKD
jgi:hypothetical protein